MIYAGWSLNPGYIAINSTVNLTSSNIGVGVTPTSVLYGVMLLALVSVSRGHNIGLRALILLSDQPARLQANTSTLTRLSPFGLARCVLNPNRRTPRHFCDCRGGIIEGFTP